MEGLLKRKDLSGMAFSNCHTRLVDLKCLTLPDQATDSQYRQIYEDYTRGHHEDPINAQNLRDAIESIKYGITPPVGFPTETVYGLGADATNEAAVAGIFAAKGRPNDNPLIVHVSSAEHLERIINEPLPETYKLLVRRFWPGPLTILLPVPKDSNFAKNVYPGQSTIGFRIPASKYARFFIAAADRPIAGPSANSSGKPSPTTAHHVQDDLEGKINFILDGGVCQVGVESTVIDGLHDPPLILRPGGVSREELQQLGGKWAHTTIYYDKYQHRQTPSSSPSHHDHKQNGFTNGAPRAPGMKYKHYSPTARLILFSLKARQSKCDIDMFEKLGKTLNKPGKVRVGLLERTRGEWERIAPSSNGTFEKLYAGNPSENLKRFWKSFRVTETDSHIVCRASCCPIESRTSTMADLARDLFGLLRLFDDLGCDFIFAEAVEPDDEHGEDRSVVDAVADRLNKAASERIEV